MPPSPRSAWFLGLTFALSFNSACSNSDSPANAPDASGGLGAGGTPGLPSGGDPTSGGATGPSSGGHGATGGSPSGGADPGLVIPVPGWPDAPASGAEVWVRVRNLCEFPLWVHASGNPGALEPADPKLESGDIIDFAAPATWTAARVTAYRNGPRDGEVEKAEMTIGGGLLNYNVTYVDWVGLPLEIVGVGPGCQDDEHVTGCYAPAKEITEGCPESFLLQGDRCVAPRSYCLQAENQSSDFCHSLDSAIAACDECPKASTPEVFACSGAYSEEPRLCAALNRGISQTPDDTDPDKFYQIPPYNTYAKWVHDVCPDIYAFSYDDWQSHGGFRACMGNELRITFCPAG